MSEAEQGEEQSLEDILTSIREKISATPDMSMPVTPVPGATTRADSEITSGISPLITPAPSQSQQHTDVFPGGLSDVLNRIDAQEQDDSLIAGDDNLSDLLDEPLPDSVQQLQSLTNPSQPDNQDDTVADNSSSPAWPPIGLTGDAKTSRDSIAQDSFSDPSDLGSFKAGNTSFDETSSVSDGGLTARIKATDPAASSASQDEIPTEIAAPKQEQASNQSSSTSEEVPRSMSALSSGFAMNTDSKNSSAEKNSFSGHPNKMKNNISSPVFGGSPSTSAFSPIPAGENTSIKPDQMAVDNERIKLSVSATNAQPVSISSEPSTPTQAVESPLVSKASNGHGTQTTTAASAHSMTSTMSTASSAIGAGLQPKTVEDMVAEMLRPMLHEWLEANLPRIVENALRIEVSQSSKDALSDT